MKSTQQFQALHGCSVSRAEVEQIIDLAKAENNTDVVYRLSLILRRFPDEKFVFEIKQFPQTGLTGVQHTGDYKEALDDCGRLRPGFKFEAGKVVRVLTKKEKAQIQNEIATKIKRGKSGVEAIIEAEKKAEKIINKKGIRPKKATPKKATPKKTTSNYGKKRMRIRKSKLEVATPKPKVVFVAKTKQAGKIRTKKAVVTIDNYPKKSEKQLALFGAKKKTKTPGLKSPEIIEQPKQNAPVNSLAHRINQRVNAKHEYYTIADKDLSNFLGKIEKKTKESVAITIAGGQGSMKTRLCFQIMNALAQNYKVGHASIEEHPESALYFDKVKQYCNDKALHNISAPEINSIEDVHKLVRENDVIVIDSFSKLQEMDKNCQLDKDFRKAYDGKLFIIIYQLTSDGKMRGGAKSQFDGDCIAFIEKKDNYKENFVYWDKNRYQDKPELEFNIYTGKLNNKQQPEVPKQEVKPREAIKFSFEVK